MTACSNEQSFDTQDKSLFKYHDTVILPDTNTKYIVNDSSFYEFKNNSICLTATKNNYNGKTTLTDVLLISLNDKDTLIDYQGVEGCDLEQCKDSIVLHFTDNFYNDQHKDWETQEWYSIIINLNDNASTKYIGKINQRFILTKKDIDNIKVDYLKKRNDQKFKSNWNDTELKTSALERIESKLFIAALNGDKESIKLFNEFPNNFQLDGSFGETYHMTLENLEFVTNLNNNH